MEHKKEIIRLLGSFRGGWALHDVFCDWVKMLALSLSNTSDLLHDELWEKREVEYLNTIKKYGEEKERFVEMSGCLVLALEDQIEDVLGSVYMNAGLGNKSTGQFFTPFHLGLLNAQLAVPNVIEEPLTLNEPSAGGGGMILATTRVLLERGYDPQQWLNVVAQDLDWKSVYMTYIQISLLGLKGIVVQGDTLSEPFIDLEHCERSRVFITPAKKGVLF